MKTALIIVGFSLAFGAIFSKTWRVYSIFTDVRLGKKPIKDVQLLVFVVALLTINVAVLIIWEGVDGRVVVDVEVDREETQDFTVVSLVQECTSQYGDVFVGLLIGMQGLILLFGTFLAFETRKVRRCKNEAHIYITKIEMFSLWIVSQYLLFGYAKIR